MERRQLLISGDVQGVFFRSSTQEMAREVGATGWVRNRSDGRVEAEVQGPTEAVDRLVAHCRTGPPHARVDAIDQAELPIVDDERAFEVR